MRRQPYNYHIPRPLSAYTYLNRGMPEPRSCNISLMHGRRWSTLCMPHISLSIPNIPNFLIIVYSKLPPLHYTRRTCANVQVQPQSIGSPGCQSDFLNQKVLCAHQSSISPLPHPGTKRINGAVSILDLP